MKPDISYQLVSEMIDRVETKIDDKFEKLDKKLDEKFVTKVLYDAEITPIKDALSRVNWAVLGAVLVAILSLVVKSVDILAK